MHTFNIMEKNREIQYKKMTELIEKNSAKMVVQADSLKSTKMRSIMNAYHLAESYKQRAKVAYVVEQFPSEIVFAFGLIGWNVELLARLFAQSGRVDIFFSLTQEHTLARDICSFIRGPFGVMLANYYPTPDIILANDQPCDCLAKLQYMASKLYDRPFFSLNTPNNINKDTVSYLTSQLKELIMMIGSTLNVKFDEEYFQNTIQNSNEAREYYCKTIQLCKTTSLPGVSRELHEIFSLNCFGQKETVQLCKTLYEEAVQMSLNTPRPPRAKRVLWVGQVPESSHELIKYIEKELEIIFWAPLWDSNAIMIDPKEPLNSIAERAIAYHWNASRMRKNTDEICMNFGIDGIILSDIWGCRNMMGISPTIRQLAKDKNLKSITINMDLVDRDNYSFTYVKNRIDAFLEII